jgi:hypothetical protein
MNLLESQLPEISVRISTGPSQFFEECEQIAIANGWRLIRVNKTPSVEGHRLDLHFSTTGAEYPLITIVSRPPDHADLRIYPVNDWQSDPIAYDEYVKSARTLTSPLMRAHSRAHGTRYRLRFANGRRGVDMTAVDCVKIRYAVEKFAYVMRYLATGAGDARERLFGVLQIVTPVSAETLPSPLDSCLTALRTDVAKLPHRTTGFGKGETEYLSTSKARAARLLEKVVDLADAITALGQHCREAPRAAR